MSLQDPQTAVSLKLLLVLGSVDRGGVSSQPEEIAAKMKLSTIIAKRPLEDLRVLGLKGTTPREAASQAAPAAGNRPMNRILACLQEGLKILIQRASNNKTTPAKTRAPICLPNSSRRFLSVAARPADGDADGGDRNESADTSLCPPAKHATTMKIATPMRKTTDRAAPMVQRSKSPRLR
jgi:hypothetical protein